MSFKDNLQDKTGIYKMGFEPASVMGILVPLLFVAIVGGGLAFVVLR